MDPKEWTPKGCDARDGGVRDEIDLHALPRFSVTERNAGQPRAPRGGDTLAGLRQRG